MAEGHPWQGMHVLYLEDEALVNMSISAILEDDLGLVVHAFFGAKDAFRAAEEWLPDFALLDVNVRGVTTYRFAEWLHERGVPVAFLSGYDSPTLEQEGHKFPLCRKPCGPDDLKGLIRTTLAHAGKV